MKKKNLIILIVVLVIVLVFLSGYYYWGYKNNKNVINFDDDEIISDVFDKKNTNYNSKIIDEYVKLYNNSDVVGEISIVNSDFKKAIMQGNDNDYYLNHTEDKTSSYMGSIYLDFRVDIDEGKKLLIKGQFRSYNSFENERNKLILTVFAKDVQELPENEEQEVEVEGEDGEIAKKEEMTNEVVLIGFVCKKPIYRQTPFGREIADLLLAVNRAYNKSDYIPTIAWGRNARFCQNLEVGAQVKIIGRVQSRQYEKKYEDGTSEMKVAYEVSICSLELINEEGNEKKEETENQEAV
mgnify:CR=1 FL=1